MIILISTLAERRGEDEDQKQDTKNDREGNPKRSQNPPPRPSDIASQFQCDEDDGQQAQKANAARLSLSVVCHFSSAFHSSKP